MTRRCSNKPFSSTKHYQRTTPATAIKAAVAAIVLLLVSVGIASPAAAETTVSVSSPSGDLYVEGKPLYVLVTVSPDQAVDGTITISNEGAVIATEQFEAAGGSTKEIVVRAPYVGYDFGVRVKTSDGGDEVAHSTFRTMGDSQPVGLSPGLVSASNPRTTSMIDGNRSASLSRFDPTWLDYGPDVLGHHNALAMAEVDYEGLSETQRESLFFWVTRGGSLIVDSPIDSPPPGLPVSFDSQSKAVHGAGNIILSNGAIAAGEFDGLFSSRILSDTAAFGNSPPNAIPQLIHDAVIPELPINLLVPLMALYVVGIGPGLWFWLRRRNGLPKQWLVVPAVAVVSTVAIWGVGTILRGANSGAHVTLVADFAGMTETHSQFIVSTATGGFTGIELQDGWEQDSVFGQRYDPFTGDLTVEATRRENEVGVDLAPGSSTVAAASRIEPNDPSWQVEVSQDGDSLTGTVTNLSDYQIDDVVVAVSDGIVVVPTINKEQTVNFEINSANGRSGNVHSRIKTSLTKSGGEDQPSSPGMYEQWATSIPNTAQGYLVVVGWSTEPDGRLESTDGEMFESGRTGFVSMVALPTETGDDSQIGTLTVTGQQQWGEEELLDGAGRSYPELLTSYRYEFSEDLDVRDIAIDFESETVGADIWDGSRWIPSGLASVLTGSGGTIGISSELAPDGVLTFRVGMFAEGSRGYGNIGPDQDIEISLPEVRFAESNEDLSILEGVVDD